MKNSLVNNLTVSSEVGGGTIYKTSSCSTMYIGSEGSYGALFAKDIHQRYLAQKIDWNRVS